MAIRLEAIPSQAFDAFITAHDLDITIFERGKDTLASTGTRFWCHVDRGEIKSRGFLTSASGNGNTPAAAMEDLMRVISEETLVIDAYKPTRREIPVPRLTGPVPFVAATLALLLCLLLPALASAQSLKIPAVGFLALNVADSVSTERTIRSVPGAYEANPLMGPSTAQRVAVKAATTSAVLVLCSQLQRRGHAKVARVVLYGGTAVTGLVAARNARVGR